MNNENRKINFLSKNHVFFESKSRDFQIFRFSDFRFFLEKCREKVENFRSKIFSSNIFKILFFSNIFQFFLSFSSTFPLLIKQQFDVFCVNLQKAIKNGAGGIPPAPCWCTEFQASFKGTHTFVPSLQSVLSVYLKKINTIVQIGGVERTYVSPS